MWNKWSVNQFHKEGEELQNYTKYKLKSSEELSALLADKDNLFVIACNKCFKEFETNDEPDCEEFLELAKGQGKVITGHTKVDFLCNKTQTTKKLKDMIPEGTEHVVVISCGLGGFRQLQTSKKKNFQFMQQLIH